MWDTNDVRIDDKYWKFISDNESYITECVRQECDSHKDEITLLVKKTIKQIFANKTLIHYEWKDDGCPYDHSGYLVREGNIDTSQTIENFLENEYTGDTIATYESGFGLAHLTYSEYLDDNPNIRDFVYSYSNKVISDILNKAFPNELTDVIIEEILESMYEQSDVYDNYLLDFDYSDFLIEFTGIGKMTIDEIISSEL